MAAYRHWKALSIDPGRTSGIALSDSPTTWSVLQVNEFDAIDLIEWIKPDIIVLEKFIVQKRPHIDVFPLELIGCIHYYHKHHPEIAVYEQMPSNIIGVTPDLVKKCGLWVTELPHGVDAIRHMMYYYISIKTPIADQMLMRDVIAGKVDIKLTKGGKI